jgi:hypothetical protein
MARIFLTLAGGSLVLMLVALWLGLMMGDLREQVTDRALRLATVHRLTGVAASLAVVFVNSVVVTYFVGTSRWCKEVVQAYGLDVSLLSESVRLKRRTFPWALVGTLAVICVGALGAAGDPMAALPDGRAWATVHFAAAIAGLAVVACGYFVCWTQIDAHQLIIRRIVGQVQSIRAARGLPAN